MGAGIFAVAALLIALASAAGAAEVSGAGASISSPLLEKWAQAYAKETGAKVRYLSIGPGVRREEPHKLDFIVADTPLPAEGFAERPLVVSGVAIVVNLPGVLPGYLALDAKTLAKIYLGQIRDWGDPAIKLVNSKITPPAGPIFPVHRSDECGATLAFTTYLSKTWPDWRAKIGEGPAVGWRASHGAMGDEGVADVVARTRGAIGYVGFATARQKNLIYTSLLNRRGLPVRPGGAAFAAAAAGADWGHAEGIASALTDQPGPDAWPIAAASFLLLPDPGRPESRAATLRFFDWAFTRGAPVAAELDYVPLSPEAIAQVRKGSSEPPAP